MKSKRVRAMSLALLISPMIASAIEVEFVNKSSWVITEVYFSSAKEKNWGEDFLGAEVLGNGDALTLSDVKAGKWDVKIVDEDDDVCILENVAITKNDKWVIDDEDLLGCQAGTSN